MKTGKVILIGGGVVGAVALAYYLYSRKAAGQSLLPSSTTADPGATLLPGTAATPSAVSPIKQTLFKDKDGNIFEFTGVRGKYGFNVKVNGKDSTSQEVILLRPDNVVLVADSNGSAYEFINGGWHQLVKNNKAEAAALLAKYGASYPLSGLGNVYLLS